MKHWIRSGLSACALAVLAACGGGGAANQAPQALALASGDVLSADGQIKATLNGTVRLDAAVSTDPDRDPLSYAWTLLGQPAGGNAPASHASSALDWSPSALGVYRFRLKVSDGRGGEATQDVSVLVDNHAPVSNLAVAVQFSAVPVNAPAQAVSVGASVVVDATASTDPDGDPVSVSFTLEQRPAGSAAALTLAARTARFTPDVTGTYQLKARGVDPSGAAFESVYTFNASNRAPNPVVTASAVNVAGNAGQNTLTASVGYDVQLTGTSTDPDGDTVTHAWQLTGRPAGSSATLGSAGGAATVLTPDVLGDYVVTLTATDAKGARSVHTTTVRVNNRRPVVQVGANATPQSLPSAPSVQVPLGTQLTLRGDASTDADGDALSHAWTVLSRPAGSTANLSSASVASPTFTPDREGAYQLRLRVTDTAGAYAERTLTLTVGTHAPVAVADRSSTTVLAGGAVNLSAALSFDEDGDALRYQWSLDAKPTGSSATLTGTGAAASFTPDVAGTYVAAVRVSDGRMSSIAYVTVRVLAQLRSSVSLDFVPGTARYSSGLDKLVVMPASGSNALRIVDPFVGAVRPVALPDAVRALSLSPNGRLAVALHDGVASLVDLATATLVKSFATGGAHTDAFVTDNGSVYVIGQEGGQWVDEPVAVFNGRTGAKIAQAGWEGGGASFYGTQYGVLAGRLNKVFFMPLGLSPADISYFSFDPATSQVTAAGDSPYHGSFPMSVPLYLSGDQNLVFTSVGTYFDTSSLEYAGRLSGVTGGVQSLTHSAVSGEALVLVPSADGYWGDPVRYPAAYKRFTGALLLPDADLALPVIGGAQSYGLQIFHSNSGRHVMLVQTGCDQALCEGARYHAVAR